ncbi:MAG: cell division protein FtsX [Myxococcota bacterium]
MRGTFFFKRAYLNFLRNRFNNFSSIVNVAVISFFSILLLFIIENVVEFIEGLVSENSAAIILNDSVSEEEVSNFERLIKGEEGVEYYKYISPTSAYNELKKVFSLSTSAYEIVPDKVLPHLFEIKFKRSLNKIAYEQFLTDIKSNGAFKEIRINSGLMELSFKVRKYSIYFKGIIFLIVCISSFYILSNTIGLNLNNNRREEIELVELLGGDYLDIRIPYILEGILVVSLGFLLGLLIASGGAVVLMPFIGRILHTGIFSFEPVTISGSDILLIFSILILSGLFGVIRFVNRFIKGLYEED